MRFADWAVAVWLFVLLVWFLNDAAERIVHAVEMNTVACEGR